MPDMPRSILVVDDEERVRELLLEYLGEFDEFELRGAASGEEALELLRQRPAELSVVDMRLPGMNGANFIEAAAAAGLCRRFLAHTGSVDFSLTPALLRLGMAKEDVFFKPVDAAEVLQRIREILMEEER
jgi:two-component system response regulator ResD